jgi:molecular chaperone DnaK
LKDAEELLKNQQADKDALEAKSEALMKASQKLGEAMYAQSQAEGQAAGGTGGQGGDGSGASRPEDEKVVDAEFTEVKDKK